METLNSKRSCYNFKEMEKDRKHKEKLIRNICEFEPPFFSDEKSKKSKKSRNIHNSTNKGTFTRRKKSLNKLFKSKRVDSEYNGKLPLLTTVQTENKSHMHTTKGTEKFSVFDSIVRSSGKKYFSSSPERTKNQSHVSKGRNKSKLSHVNSSKNGQLPAPFIIKRYNKKIEGTRIDRSRSKNDIVNWFSIVDKLIKKQKVFV